MNDQQNEVIPLTIETNIEHKLPTCELCWDYDVNTS